MNFKKTQIILLSGIVIAGIIFSLVYFWIIHPITFEEILIEDEATSYIAGNLKMMDGVYLNNYGGELPSDNYEDYRNVIFYFKAHYRSALPITDLQAAIEEIDSEYKERVICTYAGGFPDGQTVSDNFVERDVCGVHLVIYTGDCKSEEEIMEIALDLAKKSSIKVIYNMQWIGNRETSFQFSDDFNKIEFWDFDA